MKNIERDLIVPSLGLAASRDNGEITEAELIIESTEMFKPEGEDSDILGGRYEVFPNGA